MCSSIKAGLKKNENIINVCLASNQMFFISRLANLYIN
jgi:hypothetical protein